MILYVLHRSRACEGVRDRVELVLRQFRPGTIDLIVRDLSREFDRTARDRSILVVPTLFLAEPYEAYLMGDLGPDRVTEFLLAAGLEPWTAAAKGG